MRSGIVMGGCYLGMAGHDVFNNKVREIVNTNEHRVVLLALDISNFKYINDFYGMDEGDKVMQDIADFYFINEPLCLASHGIGFDQFRGAYKVDNMTDEEDYPDDSADDSAGSMPDGAAETGDRPASAE